MKPSISVICLLLCFNLCHGQRLKTPTLSPFSKISQQVGLTEVALQYSRPSANPQWRQRRLQRKDGVERGSRPVGRSPQRQPRRACKRRRGGRRGDRGRRGDQGEDSHTQAASCGLVGTPKQLEEGLASLD